MAGITEGCKLSSSTGRRMWKSGAFVCLFFPSVINVLRNVVGFLWCPAQGHELGSMIAVGPFQLRVFCDILLQLGCTITGKWGWEMSVAVPHQSCCSALLSQLELKHECLLMNAARRRGEDSSLPA